MPICFFDPALRASLRYHEFNCSPLLGTSLLYLPSELRLDNPCTRHDPHLRRPMPDVIHEAEQGTLMSMKRIAAYGIHLSTDVIALPVN